MVPALMRMYSEFMVFQNTALRDLYFSIQQLEKARTEYRAALLWMKDVSEKLENPDYRNQLARFREVNHIHCFLGTPVLCLASHVSPVLVPVQESMCTNMFIFVSDFLSNSFTEQCLNPIFLL